MDFWKTLKYQFSWKSVLLGAELFYGDRWTDGQINRETDSHNKLAVAFHNIANV